MAAAPKMFDALVAIGRADVAMPPELARLVVEAIGDALNGPMDEPAVTPKDEAMIDHIMVKYAELYRRLAEQ